MLEYEICFRRRDGRIILKYDVICGSDLKAKILAHSIKPRQFRQLEVWRDDQLVYERPAKSH